MSIRSLVKNTYTKVHNFNKKVVQKISHRKNVFSVERVDNTTNTSELNKPQAITPKLRTEVDVKTELMKIANQFKVDINDLLKTLETVGNCTIESLSKTDDQTYIKILVALERALKSSTTDGTVDLSKTGETFIQLKNEILHGNKSVAEAQREVDKNKDKDFFDILLEECPELGNKTIDEITVPELKNAIRSLLIKKLSSTKIAKAQKENKTNDVATDAFAVILCKCSSDEKAKIFAAIALLISEEDDPELKNIIPVMYKNQLEELKNKDPEQLLKFIQECPQLLDSLLPPEIVQQLKTLGLSSLPKDKLVEFRDKIIDMLEKIPAEQVQAIFQVITKVKNGTKIEELSPAEQKLYEQYSNLVSDIVALLTGTSMSLAQNDAQDVQEPLIRALEQKGVLEQVYTLVGDNVNSLSAVFKDFPINKINEVLNKVSDNKYGEVTGNVSNTSDLDSTSIGLPQRTTPENFKYSWLRKNDLETALIETNKSKEPEFLVLTSSGKSNKSLGITIPWQKYQSVKDLTAKDIYEGLTNNYIDIDKVLDNYKDLTHSAKLFVNKLIEIMSPAEQSFRLDGMANSEALDIIRHAHLNPEDLNLALDFASRKELEKMEEERQTASS